MSFPAITPDSPIVYLAVLGVIHFVGANEIMKAIRGTGYTMRKESGLSLVGALLSVGVRGVLGIIILLVPLFFGSLLLDPPYFAIQIGIVVASILFFAILYPIAQRALDWGTLGSLTIGCLFFFIGIGLLGNALSSGNLMENLSVNLGLIGLGGLIIYYSIRRLAGLEDT